MRALAIVLLMTAAAVAQVGSSTQPVLDNDTVRVVRLTTSPGEKLTLREEQDAVLVRLQQETAQFLPQGTSLEYSSAGAQDVALLIALKKHWDAEVHACAFPMKCTRETHAGDDTVAWTTTLFTNGFVTGTLHKLLLHATLDSSYYTAKGADSVIVVPFTKLDANFGGIEEELKPGQPYFSAGTQVEVNAKDGESRWFVLRLNSPSK